jgi:hypothetical protein
MGAETEPSTSYDSNLSTSSVSCYLQLSSLYVPIPLQSESMVQIKRSRTGRTPEEEDSTASYRLLYSKSKVYVNPTPYARDNIPGFVALVKKVCKSGIIYSSSAFMFVHPGGIQPYLLLGLDSREFAGRKGA